MEDSRFNLLADQLDFYIKDPAIYRWVIDRVLSYQDLFILAKNFSITYEGQSYNYFCILEELGETPDPDFDFLVYPPNVFYRQTNGEIQRFTFSRSKKRFEKNQSKFLPPHSYRKITRRVRNQTITYYYKNNSEILFLTTFPNPLQTLVQALKQLGFYFRSTAKGPTKAEVEKLSRAGFQTHLYSAFLPSLAYQKEDIFFLPDSEYPYEFDDENWILDIKLPSPQETLEEILKLNPPDAVMVSIYNLSTFIENDSDWEEKLLDWYYSLFPKVAEQIRESEDLGKYKIIAELGKGMYGSVYEAIAPNGDKVAIKKMKYYNGIYVLKEIDTLSRIDHPNIISLIDLFFTETDSNYVMPIADTTLLKFIKNTNFETRLRLAYELLSAMRFLHINGIHHCDIKPDNVLIFNGKVLLADLSLVTELEYSTCQTQSMLPPESLDSQTSNQVTEMWALGLMLLFIFGTKGTYYLTDFIPLRDIDYFLSKENVDSRARPLLRRMLSLDIEKRFLSIGEIFEQPLFKDKQYDNPVTGSIIEDEIMQYKFDSNYDKVVNWLCDMAAYYFLNIRTLISSIDLFYRISTLLDIDHKSLQSYGLTCLWIASKLYEISGLDLKDLEEVPNFKTEELLSIEIKIVSTLNGILGITTLYDLAFSLDSVVKCIILMRNGRLYLEEKEKGISNFIQRLEDEETIKERENRKSKNVTYSNNLIAKK